MFVTIDYNNAQVTGRVDDILTVAPVLELFKGYGWSTYEVDGHDKTALAQTFNAIDGSKPTVVICHTRKGHGIKEIEEGIRKWHYKQIETLTELQSLVQELQDI
jgi:transketolase